MSAFFRVIIIAILLCGVSVGIPYMDGLQWGTKAFGELATETFCSGIGVVIAAFFILDALFNINILED
jgi:hypothetical protein